MGCGGLRLRWTLNESSSVCVLCIICPRQGGYTENLLWLKGSNVSQAGACLDLSWFLHAGLTKSSNQDFKSKIRQTSFESLFHIHTQCELDIELWSRVYLMGLQAPPQVFLRARRLRMKYLLLSTHNLSQRFLVAYYWFS